MKKDEPDFYKLNNLSPSEDKKKILKLKIAIELQGTFLKMIIMANFLNYAQFKKENPLSLFTSGLSSFIFL